MTAAIATSQSKLQAPAIPVWQRPLPTKERLDYVKLTQIDISRWPQEKDQLVNDLRRCVQEDGFWYVTNYGIDDNEVIRQLSIGNAFLDLPLSEKRKHPCDFKNGNFFGFREGFRMMGESGIKDNSEALCLPKLIKSLEHEFPDYDFLAPFKGEIEAFQRKIHKNVLTPLLELFALLLELPQDYFSAPHAWDRPTEDHLRYMRYTPNAKEVDEKLTDKSYVGGHTDFGCVTLLFAQISQGLQIKSKEGDWKHVPYIPDSIVVNTADILSLATKGYLKSTIHRVIRPPEDQANAQRLGVFYFSRAAHDWPTGVIAPSPVLARLGLYQPKGKDDSTAPVTGLEFTRARVKHTWDRPVYGDKEYSQGFKIGQLAVQTTYT